MKTDILVCTFVIISRLIFLGIRDISNKIIQKIKTFCVQYFFFSKIVPFMR